jgi:nitrogen-specific signal transduction histidine kinase
MFNKIIAFILLFIFPQVALAGTDGHAIYNVSLIALCMLVLWLVVLLFYLKNFQLDLQWIDNSSLPTLVLDDEGAVIKSNAKADEQLDVTMRSVRGEHIEELIQPFGDDTEHNQTVSLKTILENSKRLYKSKKFPDAVFLMERTTSYKNSICFHLINETERIQLSETFSTAQQLSTKSKLIASAMHEIGSPLVAIEGGLEYLLVMLSEQNINSESRMVMVDITNRLLNEARRVNNIKLEFTGLFRDNAGSIEYHNLNDLVTRACNLMKYDKRMTNITLTQSLNRSIPAVKINEGKMLQILLNILSNAADALIECYWRTGKKISISTEYVDDKVLLSISDNGIGMSFDILEKAANLYFTTKNRGHSHNGSGLGLVICKDLIKQLNGSMEIESKINEGTTVKIELPCSLQDTD